jgi:hypothetical protein
VSFLAPDGETVGGEGGDGGGHEEPGVVEQAPEAEQKQPVSEIDRVAAPGERTGRDQSGRRPVRQDVGAPPPHLQHGPEVQTKGEPDQEAACGEGAGK